MLPFDQEAARRYADMAVIARAAGRTGMGAVMGSKRLKAILVNGRGKPPLYDTKRTAELIKNNAKFLVENPAQIGFNYRTPVPAAFCGRVSGEAAIG